MPDEMYSGLLCIGDPHLASRVPGFRKDDYPRTILAKLEWAMRYAEQERLLPILLGDLFHWPRENANWLLVELIDLFERPVLAVSGNHDCNENQLTDDDTLSILVAGGRVRLLDRMEPWSGLIGATPTVIGGTAWGQAIPKQFDASTFFAGREALVFWIAHHDIRFPGYEESGRVGCKEIEGVDVLINGHIHRPLEDVVCGKTTWINPGNIARVSRGDVSRNRKPSVLRIDVCEGRWSKRMVELPHESFEQVFHQELINQESTATESIFIQGLAQLQSLKTAGGAGLREFLTKNVAQFEENVAAEVWKLAEDVLKDGGVAEGV
jgi:predicted phosphodiesterase